MTVTSSTNSASYAGNGETTTFTVPFRFLANSHLLVLVIDADGTEHTQVLNTDYTASGAGNATGGVTFATAPASGKTVQIFRNVPITQEKDYVTGDKFPAESHEQALDKLTMIAQQHDEKLGRAWTSAPGHPGKRITAGAEGTVPKFDANGNLIEGPDGGEIESAQVYAEEAHDYRDEAEQFRDEAQAAIGQPADGTVTDVKVAAGSALANRLSLQISVTDPQFAATTSGDQTPASRRAAMQAAIDWGAENGAVVYFPAGTWTCDAALRFRSRGRYQFAGVERTIFTLSDDALDTANVWEPYAFDGSIEDVCFFGGFTVDGNYERLPPETPIGGLNRPGESGFVTGGAHNVQIDSIHVRDCADHGLEISCGGWVDGEGKRWYVDPDLEDVDYYPDNESYDIRIGTVIAENCGDDGVTGHYTRNVFIDTVISRDSGNRHPTAYASNGFEIDDGCRDWWVKTVYVENCNRGTAIKTHAPAPAPNGISIGDVIATSCAESVLISSPVQSNRGRNIVVGSILVRDPATPQDTDPLPLQGVAIAGVSDVSIGQIVLSASGDETDAWGSGVSIGDSATRISIGSLTSVNWAKSNTSGGGIAGGLRLTSSVSVVNIDQMIVSSPGIRAIADTGASNCRVGHLRAAGDSLSGSVGVRCSLHPSSTGLTIGSMIVTGFDDVSSYNTEVRDYPASILPGLQIVGGMINLGPFKTKTISSGAIAVGDGSNIRVAGEGGANDDLVTINGGQDGDLVYLSASLSTVDITIKHGTGNIYLNEMTDFTLSHALDQIVLKCVSGSTWAEVGRGNNQT